MAREQDDRSDSQAAAAVIGDFKGAEILFALTQQDEICVSQLDDLSERERREAQKALSALVSAGLIFLSEDQTAYRLTEEGRELATSLHNSLRLDQPDSD